MIIEEQHFILPGTSSFCTHKSSLHKQVSKVTDMFLGRGSQIELKRSKASYFNFIKTSIKRFSPFLPFSGKKQQIFLWITEKKAFSVYLENREMLEHIFESFSKPLILTIFSKLKSLEVYVTKLKWIFYAFWFFCCIESIFKRRWEFQTEKWCQIICGFLSRSYGWSCSNCRFRRPSSSESNFARRCCKCRR